jgi:hypothetical protein
MASIVEFLSKADSLLQTLSGTPRKRGLPFDAAIYKPLVEKCGWTSPISLVIHLLKSHTADDIDEEKLVSLIIESDIAIGPKLQQAIHFLNRTAGTSFYVGRPIPESWQQDITGFPSSPLLLASQFFDFNILEAIANAEKEPNKSSKAKKAYRSPVSFKDLTRIIATVVRLFGKYDPTEESFSRIYATDVGHIANELGLSLSTPELSYIVDRLQDRGIVVKGDLVRYEGFEEDLKLHKKPKGTTHPIFSGLRGPSTYYVKGRRRTVYHPELERPRALMAGDYLRTGGGRKADIQPIIDVPVRLRGADLDRLKTEDQEYLAAQKIDPELIEMTLTEWAGDDLTNQKKVSAVWQQHNLSIGEFIRAAGFSKAERLLFIKRLQEAKTSMNLLVNPFYLSASIREDVKQYKRLIGQGKRPSIFFRFKGWNFSQVELFKKILKEKCGIG